MIFYIFGTLVLDLISKMATGKKRKSGFDVPIAATSIPIVVSGLQRVIAICVSTTDNYLWTYFLPNTLKWIVVQKIIVYYAAQQKKDTSLKETS